MAQLFSELLHAALTLFIMIYGFAIMLWAVGILPQKFSPARMLGRMVRAILKGAFIGTFWLIKTLVRASAELVSGIVVGLPSPKTTSSNPALGTGKFLEGRDRRRLLNRGRRHSGLLIDGNKKRLTDEASYMHCAVIAGTGKGKTTRFVIPNILTLEHSIVALDPSGELWASCAGYLASQGFQTKLISVSGDVAGSLRFNPLTRASTPGDLRQIAEILLSTAYSDKRGENSFWNDGGKSLLFTLLRALQTVEPQYRNLPNLKQLVDSFGFDGSPLNAFIARHADESTMAEFKAFIAQPEKIMQGMLATARVALEPFSDPEICRLMSTDTLEFKTLRKEKSALFISVPEHQIHLQVHRLFLILLYNALFDFAMVKPEPHEQSLFFLLDEFGNAGAIPGFSSLITSLRKRRVSVSILLQSESQLIATYRRHDANTILAGGIGSRLYYAGQDAETAALEKTLGRHGVTIEDESGRRRDVSRNLMNADEIRTMGDDQALFIHSNQRPALIRTTPYFKNRRLRKRSQIPPPPLPTADNEPVQYLKL